MSLFHSETIACPGCGAQQRVEVASSVNADRRPELRDAILDDSLQRITCDACGAKARLAPHLTFLDVGRRQWVLTLPAADRVLWDSFERGALDVFNGSFGPEAPPAARALGEQIAVRVAFGWSGLREKLLCRQLGVDDVELELLKLLLMRTVEAGDVRDGAALRLIGATEEGALQIGWVEDDGEAVVDVLDVPRDLLDGIHADGAAWDQVRAELTSGPFVDITKALVEPELAIAD